MLKFCFGFSFFFLAVTAFLGAFGVSGLIGGGVTGGGVTGGGVTGGGVTGTSVAENAFSMIDCAIASSGADDRSFVGVMAVAVVVFAFFAALVSSCFSFSFM